MMLRHVGDFGTAAKIEHALLVTLEEGKVRTGDVVGYASGASTGAFTDPVIANLGRSSERYKVRVLERSSSRQSIRRLTS